NDLQRKSFFFFLFLQNAGSQCTVPHVTVTDEPSDEDLSLTPQLNSSTAGAFSAQCSFVLLPQQDIRVTVSGRVNLHALQKMNFKALELVIMAAIELSPNSSVFLHEERPTRHTILEIRKEEDYRVPIWIIIGSTLGGLQLLALLVLALWKLGFFHRERQREDDDKLTEQR
ncbi:integrin alpha-11, partial [Tachysurus ichikawai]